MSIGMTCLCVDKGAGLESAERRRAAERDIGLGRRALREEWRALASIGAASANSARASTVQEDGGAYGSPVFAARGCGEVGTKPPARVRS